jgi:hypothetical protein
MTGLAGGKKNTSLRFHPSPHMGDLDQSNYVTLLWLGGSSTLASTERTELENRII